MARAPRSATKSTTTSTTTKPKAMPKSKARPRRESPYADEAGKFYLEVIDWSMDYSFGVGKDRGSSRGPFEEHQHLKIVTRVIWPDKLKDREVEVVLLGERDYDLILDRPGARVRPLVHVGTLSIRGKEGQFLGTMPTSALWGLLPSLGAGKTRYIYMTGYEMEHGSASIKWINFHRDLDLTDL